MKKKSVVLISLLLTPFESKLFSSIRNKKNISKKKEIIKGMVWLVILAVFISYNCIIIAPLFSDRGILIILLFFIWSSCFLLVFCGVLFTYYRSLVFKLSQKLKEKETHTSEKEINVQNMIGQIGDEKEDEKI